MTSCKQCRAYLQWAGTFCTCPNGCRDPMGLLPPKPQRKAQPITPEYLARTQTEDGEQSALFCFAQNVVKAWREDVPTTGIAAATAPLWGLLYAVPNGGERSASQGARLKATGTKAGFPDIGLPVARRGCHGLFVEMKRRGLQTHKNGGCQQEQLDWHEKLRAQSYCVAIAYGWEEARDTIDWYLNGAE